MARIAQTRQTSRHVNRKGELCVMIFRPPLGILKIQKLFLTGIFCGNLMVFSGAFSDLLFFLFSNIYIFKKCVPLYYVW